MASNLQENNHATKRRQDHFTRYYFHLKKIPWAEKKWRILKIKVEIERERWKRIENQVDPQANDCGLREIQRNPNPQNQGSRNAFFPDPTTTSPLIAFFYFQELPQWSPSLRLIGKIILFSPFCPSPIFLFLFLIFINFKTK